MGLLYKKLQSGGKIKQQLITEDKFSRFKANIKYGGNNKPIYSHQDEINNSDNLNPTRQYWAAARNNAFWSNPYVEMSPVGMVKYAIDTGADWHDTGKAVINKDWEQVKSKGTNAVIGTALSFLGDKTFNSEAEKIVNKITPKVKKLINTITTTPEHAKNIATNGVSLNNIINEYNYSKNVKALNKLFKDRPNYIKKEEITYIARDNDITNKYINKAISRDNTFARGVKPSTSSDKVDRALTTSDHDTGRTMGFDLSDKYGTRYVTNSIDEATLHAIGKENTFGTVGIVRKNNIDYSIKNPLTRWNNGKFKGEVDPFRIHDKQVESGVKAAIFPFKNTSEYVLVGKDGEKVLNVLNKFTPKKWNPLSSHTKGLSQAKQNGGILYKVE